MSPAFTHSPYRFSNRCDMSTTLRQQNTSQGQFPPQQPIYYSQQPLLVAQQRPIQHFSPVPQWQPVPIADQPTQCLTKQQNTSAPSLNVKELSMDLQRLKEQLKKLTERGEEMGATKARAEEAHSARVRFESLHQSKAEGQPSQQRQRDASSDLIYYPSTTTTTINPPLKLNPDQQRTNPDLPSPPKRDKTDSYLQRNEERGKIMTFRNPNKQQTRLPSLQLQQRVKMESQLKQLKQRVSKLEHDLQISQLQKENLALQVKSLQQTNEELRTQLAKIQGQGRSKSMILLADQLPTIQQQQMTSSRIIERLQSELAQLKGNATRPSFDEVLKSQLEENKLLKLRIEEKNEELMQVRDQLEQEKKTNDSLLNDLSVLQMKTTAELRGQQRKLEIMLSDKANEIQTAKRALQTLELKYRTAVGEIREKDGFIMNYVVGRGKETQKDDIMSFVDQYRITFPENRTMEDLLREQREIASLKEEIKRLTTTRPQ